MPDNLIQAARDLAEDLLDGDDDYVEERQIILGLIDMAERSQAQAIIAQTKALILLERYGGEITLRVEKDLSEYETQAAKELDLAAPSWKKITKTEQAAIRRAIRCMEDSNYHHSATEKEAVDVLRKLLEET